MWLRLELRRRWRALLVLALLVALSTGVVLTAVAGARRGDSAGPRLLARTLPADAVALPNQPGFDWAPIRALPEVAALSTFPVFTPAVAGIPPESAGFPPADDQFMNTIERPVVLAGRLADPARVDESVVTANFVRSYGLGIGDTVTYRLYTPESADTAGDASIPPPPDGPSVASTIVGVVRSPWLSDPVGAPGGIVPSAGLYAQYTPNILGTGNTTQFVNALVRLRGGEADLPLFRADLARITGRTDIDVWNQADLYRKLQKTDTFEAGSLLAFGIAALAAAIVLVGQAAARYSAAALADLGVLRALGMSPRLAVTTAAAGPGLQGEPHADDHRHRQAEPRRTRSGSGAPTSSRASSGSTGRTSGRRSPRCRSSPPTRRWPAPTTRGSPWPPSVAPDRSRARPRSTPTTRWGRRSPRCSPRGGWPRPTARSCSVPRRPRPRG